MPAWCVCNHSGLCAGDKFSAQALWQTDIGPKQPETINNRDNGHSCLSSFTMLTVSWTLGMFSVEPRLSAFLSRHSRPWVVQVLLSHLWLTLVVVVLKWRFNPAQEYSFYFFEWKHLRHIFFIFQAICIQYQRLVFRTLTLLHEQKNSCPRLLYYSEF